MNAKNEIAAIGVVVLLALGTMGVIFWSLYNGPMNNSGQVIGSGYLATLGGVMILGILMTDEIRNGLKNESFVMALILIGLIMVAIFGFFVYSIQI